MTNKKNYQEEIATSLQDISLSLRLLIQPKVESRLSHIFTSHAEMSAYEFANGDNSSRDAAKHIDLSFGSITKLWAKWAEEGLLEISGKGTHKSYKANFSLIELAIFAGKENDHA